VPQVLRGFLLVVDTPLFDQAHMADEWVLVSDLVAMDGVLENWLTTPF
jgi:hypothetical protein